MAEADKKLSDHDLVVAAKTMKNHLALLNKDTKKPSDAEQLAVSLRAVIGQNIGRVESDDGVQEEILARATRTQHIARKTLDTVEEINERVN